MYEYEIHTYPGQTNDLPNISLKIADCFLPRHKYKFAFPEIMFLRMKKKVVRSKMEQDREIEAQEGGKERRSVETKKHK